MRVALRILPVLIALSANASHAQSVDATPRGAQRAESPEEVIVRGRQIGELRIKVQEAREHAYAIFNEINSNDDFDFLCRDERKYHSRATKRVCRARFESRISAETAKEYIAALGWTCRPATPDDIAPCERERSVRAGHPRFLRGGSPLQRGARARRRLRSAAPVLA